MNKKIFLLRNKKLIIIFLFGLLFFASLVYLGVRLYFSKPDYVIVRVKASPGNWWWVTPRPPDWLARSIQVGDKEYNALGRSTAEVLEVQIYDAGGPHKDVYVYTKLAASKNKRIGKYRYKGEPLEIGGPIALNLSNVFLPGMVVEIHEGESLPKKTYKEKKVLVRQFGKWPWSFDAIRVGEHMTDGSGNVIAEILEKKKLPAERETTNDQGKLLQVYSPVYLDFFITLKIRVEERGSDLVFREEQYIKVGNWIWAMFPSYNLSGGEILTIEDL